MSQVFSFNGGNPHCVSAASLHAAAANLSSTDNWVALEDCRGKSSDLVVVHHEEEKYALNYYSRVSSGTNGYWFGLRAEGGRWKWIDGSDLTVSYWTPQPPPPATDGQCVMSVQNNKWISVGCTEKQRWICKMKALSVSTLQSDSE
ncbi:C-type lectin domain family 17, member A-like [Perca flavescens]|uniref:C-type lectin domain family 17, member A-like n=1 Tax=Perca flavescens TaxID=8167 RepID=UPI00106EDBBD|nr:C-type lectin domain family 17, member A-like [Perca flavescens]